MASSEQLERALAAAGPEHAELLRRELSGADVAAPQIVSFDLLAAPPPTRAWWRHPRLRPLAPLGRPLLRLARRVRRRVRR